MLIENKLWWKRDLKVTPHRRQWDHIPRVCQNCGEVHASGQPTPSGRECKIVHMIKTATPRPEPKRKSEVEEATAGSTGDRICKRCNTERSMSEFKGKHSFVCSTCRAEAAEIYKQKCREYQAAYGRRNRAKNRERAGKANVRWQKQNKEKVKEYRRKAREKRKLHQAEAENENDRGELG